MPDSGVSFGPLGRAAMTFRTSMGARSEGWVAALHHGNFAALASWSPVKLRGVGLRPDLACRWSGSSPGGGYCGMMFASEGWLGKTSADAT
jgi:hypothetical protein